MHTIVYLIYKKKYRNFGVKHAKYCLMLLIGIIVWSHRRERSSLWKRVEKVHQANVGRSIFSTFKKNYSWEHQRWSRWIHWLAITQIIVWDASFCLHPRMWSLFAIVFQIYFTQFKYLMQNKSSGRDYSVMSDTDINHFICGKPRSMSNVRCALPEVFINL